MSVIPRIWARTRPAKTTARTKTTPERDDAAPRLRQEDRDEADDRRDEHRDAVGTAAGRREGHEERERHGRHEHGGGEVGVADAAGQAEAKRSG